MKIRFSKWWIVFLPIVFSLHMQKVFFFLFVLLSIHEGMHILCAKKLGYQIEGVQVSPIGLCAHIKNFEYKKSIHEIAITLAGLSVHILAYFLLPAFARYGMLSYAFMQYLNTINLSILWFNLIPIYPLDGGRIVRNIYELLLPIKCAKKMSIITSLGMLLYVIKLGFYQYIMGVFFLFFFACQIGFDWYFFNQRIEDFYLYRYLHGIKAKKKIHHQQDIYKNKDNYIFYEGQIIDEKTFLGKYF